MRDEHFAKEVADIYLAGRTVEEIAEWANNIDFPKQMVYRMPDDCLWNTDRIVEVLRGEWRRWRHPLLPGSELLFLGHRGEARRLGLWDLKCEIDKLSLTFECRDGHPEKWISSDVWMRLHAAGVEWVSLFHQYVIIRWLKTGPIVDGVLMDETTLPSSPH